MPIQTKSLKITLFLLTSLIILGLFLPFSFSQAETNLKSTAKNTLGKISALFKLKNLGKEDEPQSRKGALVKIFELTLREEQDLKKKLNDLKDLAPEQLEMRDKLIVAIAENQNAYQELRARLERMNDEKELKELALDFKNWRSAVYNSKVENITDFILLVQQKNVLSTSRNRLMNINLEIKALDESGAIKKQLLDRLLSRASSNLETAEKIYKQAETGFIRKLKKEFLAPQLLSPNLQESQLFGQEGLISIKSLVSDSNQKIKETYNLFIEIGKIAQEQIRSESE